jgi:hypothetical protein
MSTELVNKSTDSWTIEELLGWSKGTVVPGEPITERDLADEIFKRCQLPFGTINEAKSLVAKLEVVAPVEVPVESVSAPEKPVAPPVTVTPVPPKAPAPVVKAAETLNAGKAKSPTRIMLEENLNEYLEKMTPGRAHHGNEGELLQLKLYRTIQTILRLEGSEFTTAFGWLLSVVNSNRQGVFNERYIYRYFDAINLTNPERRNFERVINMLITTCNPATRTLSLKQVDIDATMQGFKSPLMHQRVTAFYTGM